MPVLLPPSTTLDWSVADRRRHPSIYREASSSATSDASRASDRAFLLALNQVAETAIYQQLEQTYNARFDELWSLQSLEADWDSYDAPPPEARAIKAAERSLEELKRARAMPVAVRPSNEGGVGICFTSSDKYAQIEFLNNGEAFALMYGAADEPKVWQIDRATAFGGVWDLIRAYLQS